jgi:hypothetical protein
MGDGSRARMCPGWAGVHGRRGQAAHPFEEVGLGVVGDIMGLSNGESWVDGGVDLGAQCVADPPDPQLTNILYAGHTHDCGGGLVDQGGSTASISRAPTWTRMRY